MRLTKVQIREFQSIQDSTEVEIGDVTCLVGKNESGKTAVLQALYRLNPIIEADGSFDVTDDYPRRAVVNYRNDVAANRPEGLQTLFMRPTHSNLATRRPSGRFSALHVSKTKLQPLPFARDIQMRLSSAT